MKQFDRTLIHQEPLAERKNKVRIAESYVRPAAPAPELPVDDAMAIGRIASYITDARRQGKSVMLAFGAHSIKNGLGPLMVEFIRQGWITHLATNGAGIIHDWEFAFLGESSESVAENLPRGQFGIWEETGKFINLAIIAGAYQGLGYGAAVGKAISEGGIMIPTQEELLNALRKTDTAAAAADFIHAIKLGSLPAGFLGMPCPFASFSLQAGAWGLGVPSTDHPMFGHDIIYTHYLSSGSAIGRTAETDFKSFVTSFRGLTDGGVYISLGSAVMSPMVFERANSLSPASGHHIAVVDLGEVAKMNLFEQSEPSTLDFFKMDNRAFMLSLYHKLEEYGKH